MSQLDTVTVLPNKKLYKNFKGDTDDIVTKQDTVTQTVENWFKNSPMKKHTITTKESLKQDDLKA